MSRREKYVAGLGAAVIVVLAGLIVAGSILSRRIEPYIRQQAEQYLRTRFHAEVRIASLHVRLPRLSPLRMLFTRGRGTIATVEGESVVMRMWDRPEAPPLFGVGKFVTGIDIGALGDSAQHIAVVTITGLEITIPPKGDRPDLSSGKSAAEAAGHVAGARPSVNIDRVDVKNATLVILPKDSAKKPLRFDIHDLQLQSAGPGVALKYSCVLTNPRPPGEIHSSGSFGPWNSVEPGDTPLHGDYTFDHADLGVFSVVAGILQSRGHFEGDLDSITARGEAYVPDFRLKRSGNPVPLRTKFEVLVDGTNGNTILKPIEATLGSTHFTTSGAVFKHEGDSHRTIQLEVNMPQGRMRDVLRLAMKGEPFMEGTLNLKTKLEVPPLEGKVKDKLRLDGRFDITEARFLKSRIQDQVDSLSRRGQGQPRNEAIDEVVSHMRGSFQLDNSVITFRELTFGVPGADVQLEGTYNLNADLLDFHGGLKLQAKVSQMVSGWKHWALKPVDPFFSKNGAGTYLRIQVVGDSKSPKFGLDR
jgi:hypothetical protein